MTTTDRPKFVHGGDAKDWYDAYVASVHDNSRRSGIPLDVMTGIYWPTHRLPVHAPRKDPLTDGRS